jgi:hypothetical protein
MSDMIRLTSGLSNALLAKKKRKKRLAVRRGWAKMQRRGQLLQEFNPVQFYGAHF